MNSPGWVKVDPNDPAAFDALVEWWVTFALESVESGGDLTPAEIASVRRLAPPKLREFYRQQLTLMAHQGPAH